MDDYIAERLTKSGSAVEAGHRAKLDARATRRVLGPFDGVAPILPEKSTAALMEVRPGASGFSERTAGKPASRPGRVGRVDPDQQAPTQAGTQAPPVDTISPDQFVAWAKSEFKTVTVTRKRGRPKTITDMKAYKALKAKAYRAKKAKQKEGQATELKVLAEMYLKLLIYSRNNPGYPDTTLATLRDDVANRYGADAEYVQVSFELVADVMRSND